MGVLLMTYMPLVRNSLSLRPRDMQSAINRAVEYDSDSNDNDALNIPLLEVVAPTPTPRHTQREDTESNNNNNHSSSSNSDDDDIVLLPPNRQQHGNTTSMRRDGKKARRQEVEGGESATPLTSGSTSESYSNADVDGWGDDDEEDAAPTEAQLRMDIISELEELDRQQRLASKSKNTSFTSYWES
eukprot:GFYU01043527.1.p1 GENE.GFYU01043527.1~~GFYU01043527.1.p1  ORF type:complete len:205 (-),score=10.19 GFYU01043527.1:421-978(-)